MYDGIDDAAVGLLLCRSSSPHGSTVARSHSYAVVLLLGVRRPLWGGLQGVPYIWIDSALLGDADVARVFLQLHCSFASSFASSFATVGSHGYAVVLQLRCCSVASVSYAAVLLLCHVGGPVSYASSFAVVPSHSYAAVLLLCHVGGPVSYASSCVASVSYAVVLLMCHIGGARCCVAVGSRELCL